MILIVIHNHFRPGGVRRVIELATPHLVANWPEKIRGVLLATGEAPDPAWLRAFRQQLPGTKVEVMVERSFGYASELPWEGRHLTARVVDGVLKMLRPAMRGNGVVWAHNLCLGRNPYLARELANYCDCAGVPLIAHHHDWWFDNRWQHYAAIREPGFRKLPAVASAMLAESPVICHAAINRADAAILEKHFPDLSGWLPNPVERAERPSAARVEAARDWLREKTGVNAPVWLLPCRLLRRKNIAEALLLTRWLRPEAWLVTTGGASSAEEQAYAETLAGAAASHGWPLRLGVLEGQEENKPTVRELLAVSEAVLLTSLQEGFGLAYLEAADAGRPLLARRLPNIAPDLAEFGFIFPQYYREVMVDPSWFNWKTERERQARLFADWKSLMPRAARERTGKPSVLHAGVTSKPVPFSRLTLTAQLEVLAQPVAYSWERCLALNPFLKTWRERAAAGQLKASPWPSTATRQLGGSAYARRFLELLPPRMPRARRAGAGEAAQKDFFRVKLRADNLYPLLWNIRT